MSSQLFRDSTSNVSKAVASDYENISQMKSGVQAVPVPPSSELKLQVAPSDKKYFSIDPKFLERTTNETAPAPVMFAVAPHGEAAPPQFASQFKMQYRASSQPSFSSGEKNNVSSGEYATIFNKLPRSN